MKKSLLDYQASAIFRDAQSRTIAQSVLLISADKYALDCFGEYLALTLMCEGGARPCFECSECHKILHHNHVDVHHYPQNNKTINSSEIADMLECCYQAPYAADRKIFVLNSANSIEPGMQNKLLKTLEEPPVDTYFILLATEDNSILPTIKSRCRKWHLPAISSEEIDAELDKLSVSREKKDQILEYCGGNCNRAIEFARSEDFSPTVEFVHDLLSNFRRSSQMLDYAARMYKFGSNFETFLTIFLKNCQDAVDFLGGREVDNQLAVSMARNFSVDAIVGLVSGCREMVKRRQRNCNFNTIVDAFLFMILEVRHKWPIQSS